jgi:uncharacterized protein YfdQ (DUF2303 family)
MEENAQAIIDAARQGIEPKHLETFGQLTHYWVGDPVKGNRIEALNREKGAPVPFRKRGHIQVFDARSFSHMLHSHAPDGAATIYVTRDPTAPSIVAIINDHTADGPGWGDFRCELVFRTTPQWKKWSEKDGQMMNQAVFAEFIEDNIADILAPPGAEMLEIAQYLSVTRDVEFKSAIRLQSGQIQLVNIEKMDAKVLAGDAAVPEVFTLGIAPVMGLPPYRVEARFRYRLSQGRLSLGFKLQRIDDLMGAIVNDMIEGTAGTEGRPAVEGIDAPSGTIWLEGIAPTGTR